jgi:hypothetical protein
MLPESQLHRECDLDFPRQLGVFATLHPIHFVPETTAVVHPFGGVRGRHDLREDDTFLARIVVRDAAYSVLNQGLSRTICRRTECGPNALSRDDLRGQMEDRHGYFRSSSARRRAATYKCALRFAPDRYGDRDSQQGTLIAGTTGPPTHHACGHNVHIADSSRLTAQPGLHLVPQKQPPAAHDKARWHRQPSRQTVQSCLRSDPKHLGNLVYVQRVHGSSL